VKRVRHTLAVLAFLSAGVAAWAQATDVDRIDADLEQRSDRVEQISQRLEADDVPEETLGSLLRTLLDDRDGIRADATALKSAVDEPKRRLSDLGPPPAEGRPAESEDIATLRTSLGDDVTRLTGLSTKADVVLAAIDRQIGRIRKLQGARFFSRVTRRSLSPFSAKLWKAAAADVAPAWSGLIDRIPNWQRDQRAKGRMAADRALMTVALTVAIALLALPLWPAWRRFEAKLDDNKSPSRSESRRRVAERAMSRALLTAAAGAVLFLAAVEAGLVEQAGREFARRIWLGSAFFVLILYHARYAFSPRHPEWRCVEVESRAAGVLQWLFVALFGLLVADRILAAGFKLSDPGIELILAQSVVTSSLFAALLWFFLRPRLWRRSDGAAAHGLPGPRGERAGLHPLGELRLPSRHAVGAVRDPRLDPSRPRAVGADEPDSCCRQADDRGW